MDGRQLQASGTTMLRAIAEALNTRAISAPRAERVASLDCAESVGEANVVSTRTGGTVNGRTAAATSTIIPIDPIVLTPLSMQAFGFRIFVISNSVPDRRGSLTSVGNAFPEAFDMAAGVILAIDVIPALGSVVGIRAPSTSKLALSAEHDRVGGLVLHVRLLRGQLA
jgi:hypothetical protein